MLPYLVHLMKIMGLVEMAIDREFLLTGQRVRIYVVGTWRDRSLVNFCDRKLPS